MSNEVDDDDGDDEDVNVNQVLEEEVHCGPSFLYKVEYSSETLQLNRVAKV